MVEIKVFIYAAFVSFILGIAEAIPALPFGRLTVLEPHSYAVFTNICLLFAIAMLLQQLVDKFSK